MRSNHKFANVAVAGIAFQAGSAAVDSATIMSALVFQLTGSTILVGAVTAILRFGWLFPQLIVGFLAQRSGSSMKYYVAGAFGRATCIALLALVLFFGADWPGVGLSIAVMSLSTAYAFISGIVAVPYNDIVARSVPSDQRSRLLAIRFFGGGLLALGVTAGADRWAGTLEFPVSYAAILAMASCLIFISSGVFTVMGEPEPNRSKREQPTFFQYLEEGKNVFQTDRTFRLFVFAQWCGGAVLMAMPFYVVQASAAGFNLERVALLLAAQTAGALASSILWGWWGDRLGKHSLLRGITIGRIFPPAVILLLAATSTAPDSFMLSAFIVLFFALGALANGLTIAVIGFLMEISPDDRRPAYSGYFNAITSPAFMLPLLAGVIAAISSLQIVFVISLIAAIVQSTILVRINVSTAKAPMPLSRINR